MKTVKIGIDVGGTFTHAVAVETAGGAALIGKAMVPTTHTATEGVARGVVESLHKLMAETGLTADRIALIAHSTTQATNALLEGDVATVGIIGLGSGVEGKRAKSETAVGDIELAPGKFLRTHHRFLDTAKDFSDAAIRRALDELVAAGAEVIVASESFGVDDPSREERVIALATEMGLGGTVASAISQLYGLRARTRTAVINASMLPKMLMTANMTEQAVRESGIAAPLMVMRSDGGIMSIEEMRRRPILTMLSGPAAGVAAALMYAKISDGIFLEVGGTSTDISVIKNGRPLVRTAEVGGHRLYLRTLDVRTEGVAGGSVPRLKGKKLIDVGPRSAHIAGLHYEAFTAPDRWRDPRAVAVQPKPGDPDDYLGVALGGETEPSVTLTPTGASNLLGLVTGYGQGEMATIRAAFEWLGTITGLGAEGTATEMLRLACAKNVRTVTRMIDEYKLDRSLLTLVGGGGGAEAIVPFTAQLLKLPQRTAENCEVISAIGVALGILRDTIERTMPDPTEADLVQLRQEAAERVLAMGAAPETVEVTVEVDRQTKRVTAIATGSQELRTRDLNEVRPTDEALLATAGKSMGLTGDESAELRGASGSLRVYQGLRLEPRLFGLIRTKRRPVRVLDDDGIVRLQLTRGTVKPCAAGEATGLIGRLMDEQTVWGDAGALLPDLYLVAGGRIVDLTGLAERSQVTGVARAEADRLAPTAPVVVISSRKA